MDAATLAKLEKIGAAGIELVPAALSRHFIFMRDGFASLVEQRDGGFGAMGAAGLLIDQGFAALVWRRADPFFVGKGYDRPADPEEVATLRRFEQDLRSALT